MPSSCSGALDQARAPPPLSNQPLNLNSHMATKDLKKKKVNRMVCSLWLARRHLQQHSLHRQRRHQPLMIKRRLP